MVSRDNKGWKKGEISAKEPKKKKVPAVDARKMTLIKRNQA